MSHWTFHDASGIGELTLDVEGARHNVLSSAVLHELDERLAAIEAAGLQGLIVRSGKPQGFIVGADVHEFRHITDVAQAAQMTRAGQAVLRRLAALACPTVAILDGPCLGGGLELALACRYRVACDTERTTLGLPEVKLGIHPGFGGTVRLPRLIGGLPALSLILSGRGVHARAARRLGLVDMVVAPRYATAAAHKLLRDKPPKGRPPWYQTFFDVPVVRPAVGAYMRSTLTRRVDCRHYRAPCQALSLWVTDAGEDAEAQSCAELLVSPASRHLVRLFELSEDAKRAARAQAHGISRIHVVGAGVMGADIAAWAALKGFRVSVQDRQTDILARALARAARLFGNRLKGPAVAAAWDRLLPDPGGRAVRHADLVIEAIIEDENAKRALWHDVEARARKDALFATNTSSIPLDRLAAGLTDPSRLMGLHFFNPVAKMQLVEVIAGPRTDPAALARGRSLMVALERLPIDVQSAPGFLVNRALMPYLLEAVMAAAEGIPLSTIDAAACAFGMPMGPIALADTVGLDICLSVARTLSEPLGLAVPPLLERKVAAGELGKKAGRGFYTYPEPRSWLPSFAAPPAIPADLAERLLMPLVNESMRCLREQVVADADTVDLGLVYGTGFAPFRGGPLGYARSLGMTETKNRLAALRDRYGERFAPDSGWDDESLLRRPLADA
ncbi:MAG: 3-hydroxyacyl-CoA dehydrogenase NAD-binding domain-containing protein [Gammaproteobacteria bacterium]|nr:3-hydroxyacyl-CoA dehydrogenase NAD-binding domain-containing protein [Gammaproteobacteria bacterium]